jgi:hypothetical protein
VGDLIEHETPVVPAKPNADAKPALPAASAGKAEGAAHEAASLLGEQNRKHILEGEMNNKRGNATGWHYEPTGRKEKGTYVIEGTRSPPDESGVYEANVMIEGIKKDRRSTFFPKDWTKEQVETAIEEAYNTRKPRQRGGEFRGTTSSGMDITLRLDGTGKLESAYPVYKGPRYQGPKP